MVKALPNTSFLPVPKSAPAGHTTAAAHLLWQVFPRYPCLEYKDNSGQSCPVRYTWTASFGCGLMFWQKWFNLTPQFVAYQFPGHLLHPHWYFTAYSSICQVLLGALSRPNKQALPTDQEIFDYAEQIGLDGDSTGRFIRQMEADGWQINGNPVRNWKAVLRSRLQWQTETENGGVIKNEPKPEQRYGIHL